VTILDNMLQVKII